MTNLFAKPRLLRRFQRRFLRSSKGSVNYKSILGFWWVVVAFAVPYLIRYQTLRSRFEVDKVSAALNCGTIGLVAALAVFALWRLDRYICVARGREPKEIKEKSVKAVIWCLGFFLWVSWMSAGNLVMQAYQEVNDRPASFFSR